MENEENVLPCGQSRIHSRLKEDSNNYFEVDRTPPEQKRREEKAAALAASQEISYLFLTPFTTIPRICFDGVKLGKSGVRQLVVRNPGDAPEEVFISDCHKDKGFQIDYTEFRLGGKEETTLLIGWTPTRAGGIRDNVIVKWGKFKTQIVLNGSCEAPPEKRIRQPPRPLGPKNTNSAGRGRGRVTASGNKLAAAAKPSIEIPKNPVERKTNSPPKRYMPGAEPPSQPDAGDRKAVRRSVEMWEAKAGDVESKDVAWPQRPAAVKENLTEPQGECSIATKELQSVPSKGRPTMGTRALSPGRSTAKPVSPGVPEAFKSSSAFRQQALSDDQQDGVNSRRDTFVYPAQAVVESTPKLKNRPQAGFRDPRRETFIDLQNTVPPIAPESGHNFRRETFLPETFNNFVKPQDVRRETFIPQNDNRRETFIPENNSRRETFIPQKGPVNLEQKLDPETPIRRQTYVTLPSAEATTEESWTPQKASPVLPDDNPVNSRKTYTKLPKDGQQPIDTRTWTRKPKESVKNLKLNETEELLSWTPQKASPILPEVTNMNKTKEILGCTPQAASDLAPVKTGDFKTSVDRFVAEVCTDMVGLSLSPDNSVFEPESAGEAQKSKYEPQCSDISDVPLNLTMPRQEPKSSVPEVVVSFHDSNDVPPLNLTTDDETDNAEPEPEVPNKVVVIFDEADQTYSPRIPKENTDSPYEFNYTLEHKNMVSLRHMHRNRSFTQGNESTSVNLSRNVPLGESMAVNLSKNLHLDESIMSMNMSKNICPDESMAVNLSKNIPTDEHESIAVNMSKSDDFDLEQQINFDIKHHRKISLQEFNSRNSVKTSFLEDVENIPPLDSVQDHSNAASPKDCVNEVFPREYSLQQFLRDSLYQYHENTKTVDDSMAVNLTQNIGFDREAELDEELEFIGQSESLGKVEEELDSIAVQRGASSLAGNLQQDEGEIVITEQKRMSSGTIVKAQSSIDPKLLPDSGMTNEQKRMSSGTIVKAHPSIDPKLLPDSGMTQAIEVEEWREHFVEEKEILVEEVIEEVVEYEYEIVDGVRRLIGERNMGKTVSKNEKEILTRTPVKQRSHYKYNADSEGGTVQSRMSYQREYVPPLETSCDVSKLIEAHLSGHEDDNCRKIEAQLCSQDSNMRPRSVDMTEKDVAAMLATSPSAISKIVPPTSTSPSVLMPAPRFLHAGVHDDVLPGLKGSPRISNQLAARPRDFLVENTVAETSFMPPGPDDIRRCSTGVKKDKEEEEYSKNVSTEIRKSLFSPTHGSIMSKTITKTDELAAQLDAALGTIAESGSLPVVSTGKTRTSSDELSTQFETALNTTANKFEDLASRLDASPEIFTPISSKGFALPVINTSRSPSRLSSGTYIAAPPKPQAESAQNKEERRFSTETYIAGHIAEDAEENIQEVSETRRLSNETYITESEPQPAVMEQAYDPNNDAPFEPVLPGIAEEPSPAPSPNVSFENRPKGEKEKRLTEVARNSPRPDPIKPKRNNTSYTKKAIETIATPVKSSSSQNPPDKDEGGLLFIAISPGNGEKRKLSLSAKPEAQSKSRKVVATSKPPVVSVKVSKNPIQPKMKPKSSTEASRRTTEAARRTTEPNRRTTEASKSGAASKTTLAKPSTTHRRGSSAELRPITSNSVSKTNVTTKSGVTPHSARTTRPATAPAKAPVSRKLQPVPKLNLLRQSKSSVVRHPNPFAARNKYYDERWIEKQERGFTHWLNFILTPPEGLEENHGQVDVAKLWTQCTKDVKAPRAPTREVMSLRAYTARREMNRLRRAACKLWQSSQVASVLGRLEIEVEKMRLVIRRDRNIHKDVGMKRSFLQLILGYNPLWLRIGLETTYGQLLPLGTNSDLLGLSRFLLTNLLSNPDILSEFAHPTVPHLYRDGCDEALNKFTLKKFLELIYFLDVAKESKMIRHNPCLFCRDSPLKTSRDVLITFAKDFLQGEGDVTKHLGYFGYVVNHKQTKLDEFDYAVTSIATDLRCGLRLTKVAELLTGADLSASLRMPAVSRLQKIHNTDVALKGLRSSRPDSTTAVTSKDIVDGHREKTLLLLWDIIFGFQLTSLLNLDMLREEIDHLTRSLRVKVRMGDEKAAKGMEWLKEVKTRSPVTGVLGGEGVQLLMQWAQLVLAHYGVEVENWTVSWCDGRGLCLLVHHYQPGILPVGQIKEETSLTQQSAHDDSLDDSTGEMIYNYGAGAQGMDSDHFDKLLANEKENFNLLFSKVTELGGVPVLITSGDMSNTIPDEKVTATFIGYLAVRLLDISRETKAARVIQLAWRRYAAVLREERLKVQNEAAKIIQKHVRLFLQRRRKLKFEESALTIQKYFRGHLGRLEARRLRLEAEDRRVGALATVLQAAWRGHCGRREAARRLEALVQMQAAVRMWIARKRSNQETKKLHAEFLQIRHSVIVIQSAWRAFAARRLYKSQVANIVKVQSAVRRFLAIRQVARKRRENLEMKSAVLIQAAVRGFVQRKIYLRKRLAVITLQQRLKAQLEGRRERAMLLKKLQSSITIQAWWKMIVQRRNYTREKKSAVIIQAAFRRFMTRRDYLRKMKAVRILQERLKAQLEGRKVRLDYSKKIKAIITLQAWWKMIAQRRSYEQKKNSAVIIQSAFRGFLARRNYLKKRQAIRILQDRLRAQLNGRKTRSDYSEKIRAIITLQSWCRMMAERKDYMNKRKSAIKIQATVKCFLTRKQFLKKCDAAITLQKRFRAQVAGRKARLDFSTRIKALVTLQSWWRMIAQRRKYCSDLNCIVSCQSFVRGWIARRRYFKLTQATLVLQKRFRMLLQSREIRKKYLEKRNSAISIQSWWRMVLARRRFSGEVKKIVLCQAAVRRFIQRRNYLRVIKAARALQLRVRANLEGRKAREEYINRKQNCIKIQSWWRMVAQRRRYQNDLSCIVSCQRFVRGWLARRRYFKIRQASLVLQKRFRMLKQSRAIRGDYLVKRKSAICIQSWWKMVVARRRFIGTTKRIILCQATVRRFLQRKKYLRVLRATTTLQSCIRATLEYRRVRQEYINKKQSCIKIQSWWRMMKARNSFSENVRRIVKCQTAVRGYLAYKEAAIRRRQLQRRTAAMTIQRYTRGWLARRKYTKLISTVVAIQRWTRGVLETKKQLKNYQRQKAAATMISSHWKGYMARKKFLLKKQAAVKMQAWFRGRVLRRKYLMMLSSATFIQNAWRASQLKQRCRNDFLAKKNAAVVIQKSWRRTQNQRKFKVKLEAVVVIQKYVRGYQARRYVNRKKNALVTLQRAVRGLRETRKEQQQFRSIRSMIVRLQTVARVKLAKEKFNKLKLDVEFREQLKQELRTLEAAITFQRVWRGRCARELLKAEWAARAEELKKLEETRERLQAATAAANPEDCLGARTASAIDYLFSVKDMAELLARVKVIELSTRLTEECCRQMAVPDNKPIVQIINLMMRCNRSLPHMEVVSAILEVLLNLSRVASTRMSIHAVPEFLEQMFQAMTIYREKDGIFGKICALLQILSGIKEFSEALSSKKYIEKLQSFESLVTTKKNLADQNKRRRSSGISCMPAPSSLPRRPLHPTNSATNRPNTTMSGHGLTTAKKKKPSIALCPPWEAQQGKIRFHEDSVSAIKALNMSLVAKKGRLLSMPDEENQ